MKIALFDTKPYDLVWFEVLAKEYGYEIKYFEDKLTMDTVILTSGFDAVCVFVNDSVTAQVIDKLVDNGVKLIALRCSGYNNVDLVATKGRISVVRVPNYSPTAVAEHAAALLLSVNRKTYRAYYRTRDNNFSINGLIGIDLRGKTIGVIGTGRIGRVFIKIAQGLGMRVIAHDPYPVADANFEYVSLDEIFKQSDVISLHCPLTEENYHLIGYDNIEKMKNGVIIINTSRGSLINTAALIEGLKSQKIGGAGLDVYEEEEHFFFEDFSNEIIDDDELARLLSFPNVLVTAHQAFFTKEAMEAIAKITFENIHAFETGKELENEVYAH